MQIIKAKNIFIIIICIVVVLLSYKASSREEMPLGKMPAQNLDVNLQKITYNNTTADLIQVELPFPDAVTGKEFKVIGKARGFMFEASFPVEVLDKDGNRLFIGPAHATVDDWMVDALIPCEIDVKIPESYIGRATVILRKDNPSDKRELDGSISFPITIEY